MLLQKKSLSKNQRTAFVQALFCRNIPASQVCPFPRRHDKKATLYQSSFSMFLIQLSSFNPAGLQAACANVHSPCTTVDFTFNASDVGIPDTVGSSMGMYDNRIKYIWQVKNHQIFKKLKWLFPFCRKAVIIALDFHGKRRLSHEGFFYDDPYGQYYD